MTRHRPEQRALAYAASAKDTDTLAFSARQKAIYGPNARNEPFFDMLPVKRAWRSGHQVVIGFRGNRPKSIDRASEAIQDTPEQAQTHGHLRLFAASHYPIAQLDTIDLFERHG